MYMIKEQRGTFVQYHLHGTAMLSNGSKKVLKAYLYEKKSSAESAAKRLAKSMNNPSIVFSVVDPEELGIEVI